MPQPLTSEICFRIHAKLHPIIFKLFQTFPTMSSFFDPSTVDLDTADPAAVTCYLNAGQNQYDGHLGTRISALFVILLSSAATLFPVLAVRM
jgi:hypothetical protein